LYSLPDVLHARRRHAVRRLFRRRLRLCCFRYAAPVAIIFARRHSSPPYAMPIRHADAVTLSPFIHDAFTLITPDAMPLLDD